MKKSKWVRYNGGVVSSYPCAKPNKLKIGKAYEVKEELSFGRIILVGYEGEFPSSWFDKVSPKYKPSFMAFSCNTPQKGMQYSCTKILLDDYGKASFEEVKTSPVTDIYIVAEETYRVETMNTIYIVRIL